MRARRRFARRIEGLLVGGSRNLDRRSERAALDLLDEALKHPPGERERWLNCELRRQKRIHRRAHWLLRSVAGEN